VGLAAGGACWGWSALCGLLALPDILRGAGLCLLPVLITGGVHLDGYADTCDALASHASPQRRQEILKDPHLGAFAAIRLCVYFLASFALWTALPRYDGPAFLLAFCLSRALSGLAIAAHWKSLELRFDGIYTGFMGSRRQMALTEDFLRAFRRQGCLAVVDPVMGYHGRPYRTYTPEMCRAMASLAELADVVTPNRTEAALLLGVPYEELRLDTEADCRRWAEALSLEGRRSVVLTGVSVEPSAAGAVCFDRAAGRTELVLAPLAEGSYHGTGDLFAGVLTGGLVKGAALAEAAGLAAEFVSRCARRTREAGTPVREGVVFEDQLWRLGASARERPPEDAEE